MIIIYNDTDFTNFFQNFLLKVDDLISGLEHTKSQAVSLMNAVLPVPGFASNKYISRVSLKFKGLEDGQT